MVLVLQPTSRPWPDLPPCLSLALPHCNHGQVGGIQTTLKETDEQWDAPNAWSPVQHMIIDGLMGLRRSDADELGLSLTRKWLASNHLGWENTGQMYEKYNARVPGARGEGGEYYPQVGFGWTNGVVLHLLSSYGQQL